MLQGRVPLCDGSQELEASFVEGQETFTITLL